MRRSLRYAQDEREDIPLGVREYPNLRHFGLGGVENLVCGSQKDELIVDPIAVYRDHRLFCQLLGE